MVLTMDFIIYVGHKHNDVTQYIFLLNDEKFGLGKICVLL